MYISFEKWLNEVLEKGLPIDAVAINFNLYEEADLNWAIQLVATESFDIEDEDWACDEVFSTGENLFIWKHNSDWEEVLDVATDFVNQYLEYGRYANDLKKYKAVGIGFVDGDIKVLYQR